MLKTNTVKEVFTVHVTSESARMEMTVAAENVLEALRIVREKLSGMDRDNLSIYIRKEADA